MELNQRIDIYKKNAYAYYAFFSAIMLFAAAYAFFEIHSAYFLIIFLLASVVAFTSLKEISDKSPIFEIDEKGIFYNRGIYKEIDIITWENIKKIEPQKFKNILIFVHNREEIVKDLDTYQKAHINKNLSLTGAEIVLRAGIFDYDFDKFVIELKNRLRNDNQES